TIGSRMAGLMRSASILLLSAMSTVVLLSCGGSGDEPAPDPVDPQPKGTPIAFSGSLSEGQSENHARTRATTTNPLSATHQTFHVWAYKNPATGSTETVMKNYTVNYVTGTAGTTTSNSSGWEYVNLLDAAGVVQGIKYWDFTASDYRFFGYAGTGVTDDTPDYSESGKVKLKLNADASTADLSDLSGATLYSKLWYKANSALPSQKNNPVTLEFLQPYVKVRFMFRQSESAETVFTLTGKNFAPTTSSVKINVKGTFTVTYPLSGDPLSGATITESWAVTPKPSGTAGTDYLTAFTQDYYEDDDDPETQADPNARKWYVVLPAHATDQGDYTLSVTINNEPDPRTVVVPQQYMNWLPGFEYTYVFKITDSGGITFDGLEVVKITPWTSIDDEREVYNW
ncbi:MAG: hypothetical protein IKI06_08280, partial [Prevotella sp.]|nr:hypothetical protein [Prevotella sp.]